MKDYTIDYANNAVEVSKKFAKMANEINSDAYKIMNQFRKDGFTIKYKSPKVKANKEKHKDLTIDFMERFIKNHEDGGMVIDEFYKTKKLYKGQSDYYAKLKKWFLNQFPELTSAGKKAKYTILTIDFMDTYIENHDDRDKFQGNYNKIKALYKGHKEYYSKTKEWFMTQFPKLTVAEIVNEIESEIDMIKGIESNQGQ